MDEDLKIALEDLESVESENEELNEKVKVANECVQNLREKIQKFKLRHKKVNNQLKEVNETIKDLTQKIEEKDKTERLLKETLKLKFEENQKPEQEVKNLQAENKILDNSKLLEDLINMQQGNLDKIGFGFQIGMCLDWNDKEENNEVKDEVEKNPKNEKKSRNQKPNARISSI